GSRSRPRRYQLTMVSQSNRRPVKSPRPVLERSAGVLRLLAQFRPRLGERMPSNELRAEAIVALAFAIAVVPLAALMPGRGSHSPALALMFVILYAVTSRIEFDVGSGYGVPTQLVLIPMLFALPPGWVPLLVAAAWVVGKFPSYVNGTRYPDRALSAVANAWHAVGPALVFALARLGTPRWSEWKLLLAALGAELACDLAATVAREWLRLGEIPKLAVRLLIPVYLTDVCLAPIGLAIAFAAVGHPAAAMIALPLGGLLMFFARDRRAHIEATAELGRAYRGTALLLGDVVEADDAYTGSHSRDVVELVMAVGPRIGLNEDQLRKLEFTALLHDVGKIAIPKEIINKPGPLTDDERAVIETHTIEGETMLENVGGVLSEVGKTIRSCHERYDGLGYPDGLAGDAIPIEARIVACCDAFNAMTTNRPYRAALPLADALDELRVHRADQFDPHVVDVLLTLYADEPKPAGLQTPPGRGALLSA
ncbi:MAG TPA: HD-GYP domain-containing protein, partial [Solirubrobacteraceae bacterium]|nr:HD-GYP domain-containing protein [Solirubrobacteraceae bacterium]